MGTKRKPVPAPVITKEQYDAMSPAERRVALARDVLALLAAKVIEPHSVYFWETHSGGDALPLEEFVSNPRCEVCARGALAVAWARAADDFAAREMENSNALDRAARYGDFGFVSEVFGGDNGLWEEVEAAFESYGDYSPIHSENAGKLKWALASQSPTARLRAICENLIANNGAFIPVPAAGGAS